jgi:hypothetical protein
LCINPLRTVVIIPVGQPEADSTQSFKIPQSASKRDDDNQDIDIIPLMVNETNFDRKGVD